MWAMVVVPALVLLAVPAYFIIDWLSRRNSEAAKSEAQLQDARRLRRSYPSFWHQPRRAAPAAPSPWADHAVEELIGLRRFREAEGLASERVRFFFEQGNPDMERLYRGYLERIALLSRAPGERD